MGFIALAMTLMFLTLQTAHYEFGMPEEETTRMAAEEEERESRINALVDGMMSTHPRMLTKERARRFAIHVLATTSIPKYSWIPPETLLGIAAQESDFRPWLVCEGGRQDPKGWDCGPFQTRVTIFHGKTKRARKLCTALTKDIGLAARYASREITHYKGKYCRGFKPDVVKLWNTYRKKVVHTSKLWRCLLNAYNQGPRYFREESCGSARCFLHSRYWVRVLCWAKGIETKRKIKWRHNCRRALGLKWIKKAYRL